MLSLEEIYPPFALSIACGDIRMRVLRDDDLPELVELVRAGIQAPGGVMPFLRDWHRQPFTPGAADGFPATALSWWWTQRATFAPDHWCLPLAVRRAGRLVGMQDLVARDFPQVRCVESASWLGLDYQGMGTGTLMRQLAVGFVFEQLGALECVSSYFVGNHASAGVSRKTGYVDNGQRRVAQYVDGVAVGVVEQLVRVTPATYRPPAAEMTVVGAAELRRFFGIKR